jgi:hypothetical protein
VIDEKAVADAVSFTLKETELPVPKPPPPPPMPVVPSAKDLAVPPPPPPSSKTSTPTGDLPGAALAVPLLAAFAAATFFMRERVQGETASSPTPAPKTSPAPAASSNVVDLSIPYDAAARLGYDKSDKSMTYDAFKEKFEADAVADVIAKKKAKVNA